MRHAKSSWAGDEVDHDRPLNGRGRRDATAAGRWLNSSDLDVDVVLCSSALRTRQTWENMSAAGASAGEVHLQRDLYDAHPDEVVAKLRRLGPKVYTVLVLGHNPCIEDLVADLGIRSGQQWWTAIDRKYPTSAIAVLSFEGDWAGLDDQVATLAHYEVSRG